MQEEQIFLWIPCSICRKFHRSEALHPSPSIPQQVSFPTFRKLECPDNPGKYAEYAPSDYFQGTESEVIRLGNLYLHRVRFYCKSCNADTLLPASILQGKSRHQPRLSTGEPCVAILCPKCKRVSGCTAESLPTVLSDIPNQFADPRGKSMTDVLIQCDGENCDTHIQVLVIVTPTMTTELGPEFSGLSAQALTWIWDERLRCQGNHAAWLPPKSIFLS